jgi:hypothetical protein
VDISVTIEERANQIMSQVRQSFKIQEDEEYKALWNFRKEIFRIHRTLGGYHPNDPDQYDD